MKLSYTRTQIILEAMGALIIVTISIIFIMSWSMLPDEIPAHYNAMGEIDSWDDKGSALVMHLINIGLYILLTILTFFPKIWNTPQKVKPENITKVYSAIKTMLILTKVETTAILSILLWYTIKAQPLPLWLLPVFMVIIFGTTILYIAKFYKLNKR